MIYFMHQPRSQAYLIAVGGIARGRARGNLALGQLIGHSVLNGHAGIGRARYAHSLIDVTPPRKGIAYSSAQAGGRAAEGFYFSGMIMRFVFEHNQPFFFPSVYGRVYHYGAGVILVRNVQIV